MLKSDQVTVSETRKMGYDLLQADCGGAVRSCYISFKTDKKIPKGEVVHLANLSPGAIRIHGHLSRLDTEGKFSLGYLDHTDKDGRRAKGDDNAFDRGIKNGPLFGDKGAGSVFMQTQDGVRLTATATSAMKEGAAIEGVIFYTNN